MGLRETMQQAAVTAFNIAGNIKESVSYRSKTSNPTYNPTTGAVSDPYTDYTVSMIFTKTKKEEIDNQAIMSNDEWALIPQLNLTPTPKENDLIIRNSISYNIVKIGTDPAGALWKLLIRRP